MKQIYIVGNWKSNKTVQESRAWLDAFSVHLNQLEASGVGKRAVTIVCAPFSDLYAMRQAIQEKHLPIELGAQDVSPFPEGAYTGEISARMIRENAEWVIIGHSERRDKFHENDGELFAEVERAKEAGLRVIYCVPNSETKIPSGVDVVGYEPVAAIGSGHPESPEVANDMIGRIKAASGVQRAVYGGSVNPDNVLSYLSQEAIDGVLPGGASLDPDTFARLIQAALS